jgi:hypothetical protein
VSKNRSPRLRPEAASGGSRADDEKTRYRNLTGQAVVDRRVLNDVGGIRRHATSTAWQCLERDFASVGQVDALQVWFGETIMRASFLWVSTIASALLVGCTLVDPHMRIDDSPAGGADA